MIALTQPSAETVASVPGRLFRSIVVAASDVCGEHYVDATGGKRLPANLQTEQMSVAVDRNGCQIWTAAASAADRQDQVACAHARADRTGSQQARVRGVAFPPIC